MSIINESHQKIQPRPKNGILLLDVLLLSLIVFYVVAGISWVPFHGDESAYLILSEDYDRVVKKHDLGKVLFSEEGGDKQNLRLTTGGILAFTVGFMRDITHNDDPIQKWLWGSSWEENLAQGNMPTPRLLNLARTCSAVMGAAGIVLFYLLALNLFSSRPAAWVATLAFVTQGSVLMSIRRAMQEGPKFLLLILTVYMASFILKDLQNSKMRWSWYFLLGISSGLTLAAKQDTAPMLVAVYLALALLPFWKRAALWTIFVNILNLGAATLLAYAFFLAFMPVFWGWWESSLALMGIAVILFQLPRITKTRNAKWFVSAGLALTVGMTAISPALWNRLHTPLVRMLELREGLMGAQMVSSSGQNVFNADTFTNRLPFLLENTVSSQVMYMETASFDVPPFHEQIAAYEGSWLSGRTGSLLVDGLVLVLALIGGWSLLRRWSPEGMFVHALLLVTGGMLFYMIPLSWQRYFLIMQIPYLLFAGAGAGWVWDRVARTSQDVRARAD